MLIDAKLRPRNRTPSAHTQKGANHMGFIDYTLLGNLISDILYAVVDPRVRIA